MTSSIAPQLSLTSKITVYESSDGGSGKDGRTRWQFFVEGIAVNTQNPRHAETARLALEKEWKVMVTADDKNIYHFPNAHRSDASDDEEVTQEDVSTSRFYGLRYFRIL